MRPVTTRIVGKFQTTVPPEIRAIFGLEEGDLLEWMFDDASQGIRLVAKRPQLITPQALELVNKSRNARRSAAPAMAEPVATETRTVAQK